MPTPLPPKGTVLQTAEFADSLYSPIKWSIVSRIIPYYFNSWGTGSHLYTANANTLRSVHWVKVLLALVGTHISWSPHPPLLCFYYSTYSAICQALFFAKSYIFTRRYLARTSSKEVGGFEPPSVPPKFVMRSRTALHPGANQGLLLYPYCITL